MNANKGVKNYSNKNLLFFIWLFVFYYVYLIPKPFNQIKQGNYAAKKYLFRT